MGGPSWEYTEGVAQKVRLSCQCVYYYRVSLQTASVPAHGFSICLTVTGTPARRVTLKLLVLWTLTFKLHRDGTPSLSQAR